MLIILLFIRRLRRFSYANSKRIINSADWQCRL